ncbi:hypothetical protein CC78DRAFT_537391 [Lojkania enalia]|uniref:Uncharacterized protein n=1 Tax=Lojkania enalia TaxID=147567 RepID=A0A9P4K069_9PLEO|nr:hypothetical protein CC78DRAFT_537391 [Didymosphaeria enalia]
MASDTLTPSSYACHNTSLLLVGRFRVHALHVATLTYVLAFLEQYIYLCIRTDEVRRPSSYRPR